MKTILEVLKITGEQFFPMLLPLSLLDYWINNKAFFEKYLKTDYDKRLANSQSELDNLKKCKANKMIRKVLKSKIKFLQFAKLTGYELSKQKRKEFMKVYKLTNGDLTIESVKLLFSNCKIENGMLEVKISNITKVYFACRYVTAVGMFIIFPLLVFLFFFVTKNIIIGKMLFFILSGVALGIGIHNLNMTRKEKRFLKKMKSQYHNALIA